MGLLHYVSHPEVAAEPTVPVPAWGLSAAGVARAEAMLAQPWVAATTRVITSEETKARELAAILGVHLGLEPEVRPGTGENDRSATGFLPPDEFELVADRFFAEPERSVRGWEQAVDAQARIVGALGDLLGPGDDAAGDVVVVGHGGVGTLWWCHLTGTPIDRRHDQRGQGNLFTVDRASGAVLHPWRLVEAS